MKDLILCCSTESLAQAQSSCNMILNVNCIIYTHFAFLMKDNLKKINLGTHTILIFAGGIYLYFVNSFIHT